MTDLATARSILETLVGFDTTSRRSNLALIEWVEDYLAQAGVASRRVPNAPGEGARKANLFATCGPPVEGGVILSGHTDVVPADGEWTDDPFTAVERDGLILMVDDDRFPLRDGEEPKMRSVRFRTLGCYPLTGAVESEAQTLPEVIQEMLLTTTSERQGRAIDHDQSASMEKKKQEGYF